MPTDIKTWLAERGEALFPARGRLRSVAISGRGPIHSARLDFAAGHEQVIVKRFPTATFDTAAFIQLHERLVAKRPPLRRFTPRFLGSGGQGGWILMQYIPGDNLENRLLESLASRKPPIDCDRLLADAGRCLAEFHNTPAADIGLDDPPRDNLTFLPAFEQYLARYRWLLRAAGLRQAHLQRFLGLFHAGRLAGCGDRVIPIDAQPKNVLVGPDGCIHFIDLAYSAGSPALGAALFLVSIDRLKLRHPWASAAVFARWRAAFLDGYLPHMDPETREQVCFFYPWALLYSIQQHRQSRPIAGRIASLWYARQFARFLANTPAELRLDCPLDSRSRTGGESPLWQRVCALNRVDS